MVSTSSSVNYMSLEKNHFTALSLRLPVGENGGNNIFLAKLIGLLRELISIINERIHMNFFFFNETAHSVVVKQV